MFIKKEYIAGFKYRANVVLIFLLPIFCGCNKLVHIPPPANSITTSQVFTDSADVAVAVSGIYSLIGYGVHGGIGFCNGTETLYCGLSSDELVPFLINDDIYQTYLNKLVSTNGSITQNFWIEPYAYIYQANACIEG